MSNVHINVAVIGLGSRGLSILERCLKYAEQVNHQQIHIHLHLIEPEILGVGIHNPKQPDYLLLNTICSQVSMFPDPIALCDDLSREGPDLYQWMQQKGYRLHQDGFTISPLGEKEIKAEDHIPRRILGEYLMWFYTEITKELPNNVEIHHHSQEAIDLIQEQKHEVVILKDGKNIKADFVFITVGHVSNQLSSSSHVLTPYPLPNKLNRVKPQETLAIKGFGLSSMDIIAALTVGRGGKHSNGEYISSGLEPKLILFSRSGLPFKARPYYDKKYIFDPVFFSLKRIEKLRKHQISLDYQQQIKPLILLEMCCRYYIQSEYIRSGWHSAQTLQNELCKAYEQNNSNYINLRLEELALKHGIFEPEEILNPDIENYLLDSRSYQSIIVKLIEEDLEESKKGLQHSPIKMALEIFRDSRDIIRAAVDWNGINDESHQHFVQQETSLMNRAAIGPQKERHQEILALVEAGIISFPLGPNPKVHFESQYWKLSSTQLQTSNCIRADWLVQGYVKAPTLDQSDSILIKNLVHSGRLTAFKLYNPSVNINRFYQPIDKQGKPQTQVYILGSLLEGTTFYNHYVPSPRSPNRALIEANECVKNMFHSINKKTFCSV